MIKKLVSVEDVHRSEATVRQRIESIEEWQRLKSSMTILQEVKSLSSFVEVLKYCDYEGPLLQTFCRYMSKEMDNPPSSTRGTVGYKLRLTLRHGIHKMRQEYCGRMKIGSDNDDYLEWLIFQFETEAMSRGFDVEVFTKIATSPPPQQTVEAPADTPPSLQQAREICMRQCFTDVAPESGCGAELKRMFKDITGLDVDSYCEWQRDPVSLLGRRSSLMRIGPVRESERERELRVKLLGAFAEML